MPDMDYFQDMIRKLYGNLGWNPTARRGPGPMMANTILPENIMTGQQYLGEDEWGESVFTGDDPEFMGGDYQGESVYVGDPYGESSVYGGVDEQGLIQHSNPEASMQKAAAPSSKKKFNWGGMAEGIGGGLMDLANQDYYAYDLF
jgi:hypothetical protein